MRTFILAVIVALLFASFSEAARPPVVRVFGRNNNVAINAAPNMGAAQASRNVAAAGVTHASTHNFQRSFDVFHGYRSFATGGYYTPPAAAFFYSYVPPAAAVYEVPAADVQYEIVPAAPVVKRYYVPAAPAMYRTFTYGSYCH